MAKKIGEIISENLKGRMKKPRNVIKSSSRVVVVENQPIVTKDKSRFFKETWKEEKRRLFFREGW